MTIKQARKILNLSQEEFAKKLEVSVRTIGNWESGSVEVPAAKMEKIKAMVANSRTGGDVIEIGAGSPGAGKDNYVNNPDMSSTLLRAMDEISAQLRLTEDALARLSTAQNQINELLLILKSKVK